MLIKCAQASVTPMRHDSKHAASGRIVTTIVTFRAAILAR